MIKHFKFKKFTWVEVYTPTYREIKSLQETFELDFFNFSRFFASESEEPILFYPEYINLTLSWPVWGEKSRNSEFLSFDRTIRLDLLLGENFVIVINHDPFTYSAIGELSEVFNSLVSFLDPNGPTLRAELVLYYLIRSLHRNLDLELNILVEDIKKTELEKPFDPGGYQLIEVAEKIRSLNQILTRQFFVWRSIIKTRHQLCDGSVSRMELLLNENRSLQVRSRLIRRIAVRGIRSIEQKKKKRDEIRVKILRYLLIGVLVVLGVFIVSYLF